MGSLGQNLREMREGKGLTLEEFSELSGLNIRALFALENEKFDFFRGNFYFVNYLKSYLEFLKVDVEKFFSRFEDEINSVKKSKNELEQIYFSGIKYSKFSRSGIWIKIIVPLVLLSLIFYFGIYNKKPLLKSFSQENRVVLPGTGMNYNYDKFSESDYSPVVLDIKFKGNCWVQIFRGNKKYIENVFLKGEKISVSGYELLLLMGNPSAAEIFLNNKKVSRFADSPKSIRLRINPHNIENIY